MLCVFFEIFHLYQETDETHTFYFSYLFAVKMTYTAQLAYMRNAENAPNCVGGGIWQRVRAGDTTSLRFLNQKNIL